MLHWHQFALALLYIGMVLSLIAAVHYTRDARADIRGQPSTGP